MLGLKECATTTWLQTKLLVLSASEGIPFPGLLIQSMAQCSEKTLESLALLPQSHSSQATPFTSKPYYLCVQNAAILLSPTHTIIPASVLSHRTDVQQAPGLTTQTQVDFFSRQNQDVVRPLVGTLRSFSLSQQSLSQQYLQTKAITSPWCSNHTGLLGTPEKARISHTLSSPTFLPQS